MQGNYSATIRELKIAFVASHRIGVAFDQEHLTGIVLDQPEDSVGHLGERTNLVEKRGDIARRLAPLLAAWQRDVDDEAKRASAR